MKSRLSIFVGLLVGLSLLAVSAEAVDTIPPLPSRFSDTDIDEVPDFQKHVVPLLSRLGCNGRACHGSFQGRGGFQLSLLEFYFKKDHKEIRDGRLDVARPQESLILNKSTNANDHEGGLCFEKGS